MQLCRRARAQRGVRLGERAPECHAVLPCADRERTCLVRERPLLFCLPVPGANGEDKARMRCAKARRCWPSARHGDERGHRKARELQHRRLRLGCRRGCRKCIASARDHDLQHRFIPQAMSFVPKSLLLLALSSSAAAALFEGRAVSAPKPAVGATRATSRLAGKVVPTGRAAAIVEAPEPFGEVAQTATDLTVTALRLGTCALMVHHGFDKLDVRVPLNPFPSCVRAVHVMPRHTPDRRALSTVTHRLTPPIGVRARSTSTASPRTSSSSSSASSRASPPSGPTPPRRRRSAAPASSASASSRAPPRSR